MKRVNGGNVPRSLDIFPSISWTQDQVSLSPPSSLIDETGRLDIVREKVRKGRQSKVYCGFFPRVMKEREKGGLSNINPSKAPNPHVNRNLKMEIGQLTVFG